MEIAILLYDGATALDAVGPYEVLSRLPGARVRFVATKAGPVRMDSRMLGLVADASLDEVRKPDVVLVPGGVAGTFAAMGNKQILEWLAQAHETSQLTTSVCSGALILGAAGLLRGVEVSTHWAVAERLAALGATHRADRIVEQGKIVSAAGVSAGIDMALHLAARLAGEEVAKAIQLVIEYDPQPPFDSGSPHKASDATRTRAQAMLRSQMLRESAGRMFAAVTAPFR